MRFWRPRWSVMGSDGEAFGMWTCPQEVSVDSWPSSGEWWSQDMRVSERLQSGCLLEHFVFYEVLLCHCFDMFPE